MARTSLTQIFYNAAIPQAASTAHCENSFRVTRFAFALCAKAAFPPERSLPDELFEKIMG